MLETGLSEAQLLETSEQTWVELLDEINARAEKARDQAERAESDRAFAAMKAKYGGRAKGG